MCSPEEPIVIILIKTNLADMTATLDSGPVTKTVFTHSLNLPKPQQGGHHLQMGAQPKTQCRWKVSAHEEGWNWM